MNAELVDLGYKSININKKLKEALFIHQSKETFGSFRLLMKLHKDKFSSRSIINNRLHFTWKISLFIEKILRPFVEKMFSFLKDSQDLMINSLNKRYDPNKVKICSADFVNMYPTIIQIDCKNRICDFLNSEKFECKDFTLLGFKRLLDMLFKYNYFIYKSKVYRQKNGITAGTKCGPSLANLYVYTFEIKLKNLYSTTILCYHRFIDDLFLIFLNDFDLNILNDSFGNLQLTFSLNKIVNYLDLNISICNLTHKLTFSLFIKPTNTFSYLLSTSNHKTSIYKNIIVGLLIRIRRICTNFSDFLFFSFKLKFQLLNRGYNSIVFDKIFDKIQKSDREAFLPYKEKEDLDFNNKIYLKQAFDTNCENFKNIVKTSYNTTLKNKIEFKKIEIKIMNYNQMSLAGLILHFRGNLNFLDNFKYRFCKNKKCITCYYANSNSFININSFKYPILNSSTCTTKNCIYIIECKLCNAFYIGESGVEFKVRFANHMSSIKNFEPYNIKKSTQVAIHFNLKNHNMREHLNFYIHSLIIPSELDSKYDESTLNEINKIKRHNVENIVYNFFVSLGAKTMNYFKPHYDFIKYDKQIYDQFFHY